MKTTKLKEKKQREWKEKKCIRKTSNNHSSWEKFTETINLPILKIFKHHFPSIKSQYFTITQSCTYFLWISPSYLDIPAFPFFMISNINFKSFFFLSFISSVCLFAVSLFRSFFEILVLFLFFVFFW